MTWGGGLQDPWRGTLGRVLGEGLRDAHDRGEDPGRGAKGSAGHASVGGVCGTLGCAQTADAGRARGRGSARGSACTVLFASPSLGLAPIVTVLRLGELASCRMAVKPPRPPSARPPLDSHFSLSGAGFGQARLPAARWLLLPAGSGVWDPERGNLACVEAPGSTGRGRFHGEGAVSGAPVRQPLSCYLVSSCEQLSSSANSDSQIFPIG